MNAVRDLGPRGHSGADYVLGWNLDQWAQAQAWFESVYGWSPLPDLDGANRVLDGWVNRRDDQPSPDVILVPEFNGWLRPTVARNRGWARRLFRAVAMECAPLRLGKFHALR